MDITRWGELVKEHLKKYPAATEQDVYKLLYQGLCGPEHIIKNKTSFTENLQRELVGLEPDAKEILFEPIRPDGKLCRVHLRAWLATGQDLDQLVNVCLHTSQQKWSTQNEFIMFWQAYSRENPQETNTFTQWLDANHYPLVHHSDIFCGTYKPAYRLVMN